MNNSRGNRGRDGEEPSGSGWGLWAGLGAAAAAVATAASVYYITKGSGSSSQEPDHERQQRMNREREQRMNREREQRMRSFSPPESLASSATTYLNSLMERVSVNDNDDIIQTQMGVRSVPDNPIINNLNSLLADIYVRYVALRQDDFELHYYVFDKIFHHLHRKMKDVDLYYQRYSSTVQFAGSHYDRLRIKKPDEFDMDVVIDMPLSIKDNPFSVAENDFIIEPKDAGYVHLKMGVQFRKLPDRDGGASWEVNKAAFKWKDDDYYLLRSKFMDWFKGVVDRALNQFEHKNNRPVFNVNNVEYTIEKSASGPAITLIVMNRLRNFRMDVDLVPALKFPEDRWPIGEEYRQIPTACRRGYWMVVPKPNKNSSCQYSQSRSWRIALHYQERELMHNTYNLRPAIKLIKKLRDSQDMGKIASYYIKTLAFWEIVAINDAEFWQKSPAVIFKLLVKRFYEAMVKQSIPYFWNRQNNLVEGIHPQVLNGYALKLKNFITVLESPEYKKVAKFLLTPYEFEEYNRKYLGI